MKKFLISLLLTVVATSAMAVPAKRGLYRTVTLADGSKVKVQLVGDEFGHAFMDDNGRFYRLKAEDSQMAERITDVQMHEMAETKAKKMELRNKALAITNGINGMAKAPAKAAVYKGKKKALVILIEFTDKKFSSSYDINVWDKAMNQPNYFSVYGHRGSLHDYFLTQSNGQFELEFDVIGPVTAENKYAYYGGNDASGSDKHPGALIGEACTLADEFVNYADYDWNNDGKADLVYVVYAGYGEASSNDANSIWPHAWELSSSDFGKSLKLDGITVNKYACSNELQYSNNIDGPGTIAHEFSHCLGYPDLYDINYECYANKNEFGGYGDYDLMDGGSYNDNGFSPPNYSAYERMVAGWTQPIELNDEPVEVNNLSTFENGGDSYIVYNSANNNEFYIFENRQVDGWDRGLPGSGLMITYVDYNAGLWDTFNQPNCQSYSSYYQSYYSYYGLTRDSFKHRHCALVPADGSYINSISSQSNDLWPYGSKNTFSNESSPASVTYNKNSDGTLFMNIKVSEITDNYDGTVSFKYERYKKTEPENPDEDDEPTDDDEIPHGDLKLYESFDQCSGQGGNDGKWSNISTTSGASTDLEGWTSSVAYGASKCVRVGNTSKTGTLTTPALKLSGKYVMTFKAAAWNGTNDATTLNIKGTEGITLSKSSVKMKKGAWITYYLTVDINPASDAPALGAAAEESTEKITIASEKGRFFLDEVKIFDAATNGLDILSASKAEISKDNRIFSIDGRFLGADINALPHGIYIKGGKKIVK